MAGRNAIHPPSFPTNSIGMLDLNSIAVGVSPAFSLEVEHPTGKEYAAHLQGIAKYFELPVRERTKVRQIVKSGDGFAIRTGAQLLRAKHVIWAAGEFQYPRLSGFEGSELCRHTATVASYDELDGDEFIVIGGYESGVDAACHLSYRDKRVRMFDRGCPWSSESSDPSIALSTYSLERMREDWFEEFVELFPETPVNSVVHADDRYEVAVEDGRKFHTRSPPLLAGGFEGSHKLVADLFEQRDDGFPLLTEQDESTIAPGMFLCGPAVRHDNHVFCFIYKYRQRFAEVLREFTVNGSRHDSFSYLFDHNSAPVSACLLNGSLNADVPQWFSEPHVNRILGAAFQPRRANSDAYYEQMVLSQHFEVVMHVRKTERARPLSPIARFRFGAEFSTDGDSNGDMDAPTDRAPAGAHVTSVLPRSLAERSGLQAGDRIVRIGRQHVTGLSDFEQLLADIERPGSHEMTVLRETTMHDGQVKLQELTLYLLAPPWIVE